MNGAIDAERGIAEGCSHCCHSSQEISSKRQCSPLRIEFGRTWRNSEVRVIASCACKTTVACASSRFGIARIASARGGLVIAKISGVRCRSRACYAVRSSVICKARITPPDAICCPKGATHTKSITAAIAMICAGCTGSTTDTISSEQVPSTGIITRVAVYCL